MERDPIVLFTRALVEAGTAEQACEEIRANAEAAVNEALERAMGWAEPAPESRLEHVLA
jgi:TPP-dependent pyruvate/acetoin dehydrogenase alpha subunit